MIEDSKCKSEINFRPNFVDGFHFFHAFIKEVKDKPNLDRRFVSQFRGTLAERGYQLPSTTETDNDWDMLVSKLIRFRPRLTGSLASYSIATRQSSDQIRQNGGYDAFKMLWFLGSSQDDLIDQMPPEKMIRLSHSEKVKAIKREIFGQKREFYQAGYQLFNTFIEKGILHPSQRRYIKTMAANWYKFLLNQEASVFSVTADEMFFDYCVNYREQQNGQVGKALVACLNGNKCLDSDFQALENILPLLSYRTQIIDDIADLKEDLDMRRPSYAVGGLTNHPCELASFNELVLSNDKVHKVTPKLFQRVAPNAFELVQRKYQQYGDQIRLFGSQFNFLSALGDCMFYSFPQFRDSMYRVNPSYANF